MPNAAKRICSLHRLIHDGKCPKCKASGPQQHKGTSNNRSGDPFYSSKRWKRLRIAFLRANPLCQCEDCLRTGAVTAADRVDHIKPRCDYPELELEWDNLRSMSEAHHNRHTARTRKR